MRARLINDISLVIKRENFRLVLLYASLSLSLFISHWWSEPRRCGCFLVAAVDETNRGASRDQGFFRPHIFYALALPRAPVRLSPPEVRQIEVVGKWESKRIEGICCVKRETVEQRDVRNEMACEERDGANTHITTGVNHYWLLLPFSLSWRSHAGRNQSHPHYIHASSPSIYIRLFFRPRSIYIYIYTVPLPRARSSSRLTFLRWPLKKSGPHQIPYTFEL